MSIIPHIVVGAAVGSLTQSIPLAAALGFASHFVLDFIPHYDPTINRNQSGKRKLLNLSLFLVDLFVGLGILWLVRDYPTMVIAGLVGALIDLENFFPFIRIHHIQPWHNKTTLAYGLINQGWVFCLGMIFILQKIGYEIL